MAVITISRGSFSGGKMLAECLAQKLGYRCIDRDVIVERAAANGVSQEELRDALEKPPTLLERFSHKKYLYLTLIQAALVEEVREGRAIYHGNAGHLLLKKGGPVFSARIIAPQDLRVKMCVERLKLSRGEALAYIQKTDSDRHKWTQFLYGVNWEDPALYDIVVNLEHLSIEDACESIYAVVRRQACYVFGPECRQTMENLALACRVKAALALARRTAHLEVEAEADGSRVWIRGRLSGDGAGVQRIARQVHGVAEVTLEDMAALPRT